MPPIVEIAGRAGAGELLVACMLLSRRRIGAESVAYQGLTVVGPAGLVVNGRAHDALSSVALNLIWRPIGGRAFA